MAGKEPKQAQPLEPKHDQSAEQPQNDQGSENDPNWGLPQDENRPPSESQNEPLGDARALDDGEQTEEPNELLPSDTNPGGNGNSPFDWSSFWG
ncbi:MAG TPA: hypothetical protein VKP30_03665 [Polyangiaceae bacterium]|nr:hypothetical protein [Polyangiaceae bacterium]